jgi:maleylacetate reductase
MTLTFAFEGLPGRVVFGAGSFHRLPEEADRLGLKRILILATQNHAWQAKQAASILDKRSVGTFTEARMHTPVEVTEKAIVILDENQVDGIVAIGGGSTIGLSKALALRTDLPQIVVPTTYAGSEMTDVLGETSEGVKTTKRSPRIRSEVVIYDVNLTLSLPARVSACSGLNAIAHAVEALYARDTNPLVCAMAEEGTRALVQALPTLVHRIDDDAARTDALYGAWLCGSCLASAGMGLHHKLCHVLGGTFNLPHAETHAILLPHTLAYNAPAAQPAVARLCRALTVDDPVRALYQLARRCNIPVALSEIGLRESDLDRAVELAMQAQYWNPRPIDRQSILELLKRALRGAMPDFG